MTLGVVCMPNLDFMKTMITTTFFLMLGVFAYSQESESYYMTHDNFNQLDKEIQDKIVSQVIFIGDHEQGIAKANHYQEPIDLEIQQTRDQYFKLWLKENEGVKIVKQSEYQNADPDLQNAYDAPHVLVLIGEQITIEDIQNF